MSVYLLKSALIQPRLSPLKFAKSSTEIDRVRTKIGPKRLHLPKEGRPSVASAETTLVKVGAITQEKDDIEKDEDDVSI